VDLVCFILLLADFVVSGVVRQFAGQVIDKNVGGGHAEDHTSEFVKLGKNLADSFDGVSGAEDNICLGSVACSLVLATL
jgi:hypothetical protein